MQKNCYSPTHVPTNVSMGQVRQLKGHLEIMEIFACWIPGFNPQHHEVSELRRSNLPAQSQE